MSRKSKPRRTERPRPRGAGAGAAAAGPRTAYDVLGLPRQAPASAVQERYRALLAAHPPERDPEGFEQLHAAYAVLGDAASRQRYNKELRMGRTYDAVLAQALRLAEAGQWELARLQAHLAHTIDGRSPAALMLQAECDEQLGDPDRAWAGVSHVLSLPAGDAQRIDLMLAWARWGYSAAERLRRLDRIAHRFPKDGPAAVAEARFGEYIELGEQVQAHRAYRQLLDLRRPLTTPMFDLYLAWLEASLPIYGTAVPLKRLHTHAARGLAATFDRAGAKQAVMHAAKRAAAESDFAKQALMIEVARLLDPGDRSLALQWLAARDLADLKQEMFAAYFDETLPAAVREVLWESYCRVMGLEVDRRPVDSPLTLALRSLMRGSEEEVPRISAAEFAKQYPALARRFPEALAAWPRSRPRPRRQRPLRSGPGKEEAPAPAPRGQAHFDWDDESPEPPDQP